MVHDDASQPATKDDLAVLRGDLTVVIEGVKGDLKEVKNDLAAVKEDLTMVKGDLAVVQSDLAVVKSDLVSAKDDVKRGFKIMHEQFQMVLELIEQSSRDTRQYLDERIADMDQKCYNRSVDQDVLINGQEKRLRVVERRMGIAA